VLHRPGRLGALVCMALSPMVGARAIELAV
jgi:hypothetical protein